MKIPTLKSTNTVNTILLCLALIIGVTGMIASPNVWTAGMLLCIAGGVFLVPSNRSLEKNL